MPEAMFPVLNPASETQRSQKMREYKARIIQVEHGDFTLALEKLTEQIAARRELPDSVVAGWLRCRFSFALLRTSLICLRGTRTKKMVKKANVELAVHEAH